MAERVLAFDTETTTGFEQRLLFGVFRIHEHGTLLEEGIFFGDGVSEAERSLIGAYADLHDLPVYTREEFVDFFYEEVYVLGTLCVGFNLPFDLSRIAIRAGSGRGENRRKFRFKLTRRVDRPHIRIEAISGRAAFITFAPMMKLKDWEHPFFDGRFLDLSTLSTALTGEKYTLARAAIIFKTEHRKTKTESRGVITPETLDYGRNDTLVTWELFEKLTAEYLKYPFATLEHERRRPAGTVPFTEIYSTASIAKALLRASMGIAPLLAHDQKPDPKIMGHAMSSYFGGRSEVRTRRVDVPVRVVDFTSMYPSVFLLENLQELLTATELKTRDASDDARRILADATLESLYDPALWPKLRCIVRVRPNGETLPVRFRMRRDDPYSIAVTPFTSSHDRWYTLADVIAAKLLGGTEPEILEATEFYATGQQTGLKTVDLLGVTLDPRDQIFRTVVEARQRYKDTNPALAQATKILLNVGAYGAYAELNVTPDAAATGKNGKGEREAADRLRGVWYADIGPVEGKTHNERPGTFFNPVIASLVTGGARLILAMAEAAVRARGGTFAFADTDSLAIVAGEHPAKNVPCLSDRAVREIIDGFNRLNPYDPDLVPDLLKLEYKNLPDLRCWAVSAKRYVLFTRNQRNRLRIVKASESGLGATLGRTDRETVGKLARRIWLRILVRELPIKYRGERKARVARLTNFDLPMRRRLPITQPHVYDTPGFKRFNRAKSYDARIKPFGFLQTITPAKEIGRAVQPIAPSERDIPKSRRLPWTDFRTGKPIKLDWDGNAYSGTVPVMRLDQFVELHEEHPEAKAAAPNGVPASEDDRGVLGRLRLYAGAPRRIGKEVDRLDEDDEYSLGALDPAEYTAEGHTLKWALQVLAPEPATEVAPLLGIHEKSFRMIRRGLVTPHRDTREDIIRLAESRESTKIKTDE